MPYLKQNYLIANSTSILKMLATLFKKMLGRKIGEVLIGRGVKISHIKICIYTC